MEKSLFYILKRRYGNVCEVYRVVGKVKDRKTGISTDIKDRIPLNRVIISPTRLYINTNFKSTFKMGDKELLVWKGEALPKDFVPNENDYFVIKNEIYNIIEMVEEESNGYWIHVRKMQKQLASRILEMPLKEQLSSEMEINNE